MRYSVSRVQSYMTCPYKYRLKYVDELKTYDDYSDPANALYLGTALHTGLEKNVEEAVKSYYMSYPIITDLHVNEAMKLENLIPKAKRLIPDGQNEVKIESDIFIGFIDLLVRKDNGHYDIWDFKYSNNVDHYLKSFQLHVYKYYFEAYMHEKVDDLYYLIIPKTAIRQKKTEDLVQFRKRLNETLSGMTPDIIKVNYDYKRVEEYKDAINDIETDNTFEKCMGKLCPWCEYSDFCQKSIDLNIDWEKTRFKNLEDYKEAIYE